jgi:hypothetical protein
MSIQEISEVDLLSIVTPIVEKMQTGWDIDNYEQFLEYFTDVMKEVVNKENYEQQRNRIFSDLGIHKKLELITIHKNPGNTIVIWKLHCEKRELPALLQYTFIEKDEKILIEGATIDY